MSRRADRLARRIRAFVENPMTNLVKGVVLMLIGLSDAARTYQDDVARGKLTLGHGLVIIGFFSILTALPHLIEAMEAGERVLEAREQVEEARDGTSTK